MALEPYTIERGTGGLERLDKVQQGSSLSTGILDVIVIDVELGGRISRASRVQSDSGISCAQGVVEDVASPCSVVVASRARSSMASQKPRNEF